MMQRMLIAVAVLIALYVATHVVSLVTYLVLTGKMPTYERVQAGAVWGAIGAITSFIISMLI